MLNIFQYICEATGAVFATGALSEIFDGIKENVDACVFQNGHIDYDKLDAESFDRDMPIKFDKLRMKLEAAKRAGYDKAITFEFSHFMSPQSAYLQAGHLYDRYCDYFGIDNPYADR